MNQEQHTNLSELSEFVREKIGIYFSPGNHNELYLKLKESAREKGYESVNKYIDFLKKKDDQVLVENLASRLTVGETYFLRDRELFRRLEEDILPGIIERKSSTSRLIRIWSAASSSGEEAYSVAILLDRLLPNPREWNIQILATDINHIALSKAKQALYTEWSFRTAPEWLKEKYFESKDGKSYQLIDKIRKMVDFRYLNLVRDEYPSLSNGTNAMDLVLCRNVLIYFAPEDIIRVTEKIYNCLVDDGVMVTTPTESYQHISSRFKLGYSGNCAVYSKQDKPVPDEMRPVKESSLDLPSKNLTRYPRRKKRIQSPPKVRKRTMVQKEKQESTDNNFLDRADTLFRSGNYLPALEIIESAEDKATSITSLLLKSRIMANLGRLDSAKKVCNQIHKIDKLNAEAYYVHAMIEQERDDTESALKYLRNALFLEPDMIIANYALAVILESRNDKAGAMRYYRNTLENLKETDPGFLIPEADGITAGRLTEILEGALELEF